MGSVQKFDRPTQPRPDSTPPAIETLHEIRDAILNLNAKFDEFARVFLNAKFPYGKPVDRWRR